MEMHNTAELQEILVEAQRYVVALMDGSATCASHFENNENAKGMELLLQIIDGLEWLIGAVRATKPLQSNPINPNEATGIFSEIVEALENKDYALCGELLKYELIPLLESWQNHLHQGTSLVQ